MTAPCAKTVAWGTGPKSFAKLRMNITDPYLTMMNSGLGLGRLVSKMLYSSCLNRHRIHGLSIKPLRSPPSFNWSHTWRVSRVFLLDLWPELWSGNQKKSRFWWRKYGRSLRIGLSTPIRRSKRETMRRYTIVKSSNHVTAALSLVGSPMPQIRYPARQDDCHCLLLRAWGRYPYKIIRLELMHQAQCTSQTARVPNRHVASLLWLLIHWRQSSTPRSHRQKIAYHDRMVNLEIAPSAVQTCSRGHARKSRDHEISSPFTHIKPPSGWPR